MRVVATIPQIKGRWVTFPLDVPAIVRDYARRYLDGGSDHDTIDDAALQCSLDLQIPKAKGWFYDAVKELKKK